MSSTVRPTEDAMEVRYPGYGVVIMQWACKFKTPGLILSIISHALKRIQVSLLSVILRAMAKYTKLTFVNITTDFQEASQLKVCEYQDQ